MRLGALLLFVSGLSAGGSEASPSAPSDESASAEHATALPIDAGISSPEPSAFAPESVPFAFADFSWLPGNAGPTERPLSYGPFTGEVRLDAV